MSMHVCTCYYQYDNNLVALAIVPSAAAVEGGILTWNMALDGLGLTGVWLGP